ncbi:hypothetical protein H4R21_002222 [Coemansia helicoidea]|uniref:Uncharacterized protein n=1 Tax=Coemansia helicoidea TaxID=1286919 RepID=A0ACC1L9C3_9FUNG|nr:hypothetical protein H4R21_002222 [Coemansia helicoidea]
MDTGMLAQVALAQLRVQQAFDGCIESRETWSACLVAMAQRAECQVVETAAKLFSTAIVTITVEADLTIRLDSNIPEILGRGQGWSVRYLVVHTRYWPTDGTRCQTYWALAGILSRFTGLPEAALAAGVELGSVEAYVAAMVETAVAAMPNLQGVLVARIGEVCCLTPPDSGPRHIAYCAAAWAVDGLDPLAVPRVIAASRDQAVAVVSAADLQPSHLPLSVSALDYLSARPLPFPALAQIWDAALVNPQHCAHTPIGSAARHLRRHVLIQPGITFIRSGRGGVEQYDWCRIVLTQELA